ncbi:MAG: amino acid ABC transporter permease [Chloroflexi bacterium HGW-Chloroflexi-1]|nr:MAG: amino acid ABC transporter permease [Chloroflexi bacterium HGW-Chloroflexi-1]
MLQWVAQIVSAVAVVGFLIFFANNVLQAAHARGLDLGYGFVGQAAGFPLGESLIEYDPAHSFGYAFLVGILNTLKVALVSIVLATLLGILAALARLSTNWLVSKIASVYIELIRNIPLLVQLFFWYFAVFLQLPSVQESFELPGPIYLSQRGLYMVWARPTSTFWAWLIFLGVAVVLSGALHQILFRYQIRTGRTTYPVATALVVLIGLPLAGWFLVGGTPLAKTVPELGKFNFSGGLRLTPEFAALLAGLVIYTGAFTAEVVRAGILAVNRGQFEAARALGLSPGQVLRLVVFPQALRVIIPPLISQYLNLTKNSSLAVLIGYPDLFFVGRTIINQAGRAVPVFGLIMASYLVMSLTTSVIMNIYNRRVRLVER